MVLYFGNRKEAKDFLYKEEWEMLVKAGTLHNLYTAFSRDQEQKVYVQSVLLKNAARVWDTLANQNGVFMLAG